MQTADRRLRNAWLALALALALHVADEALTGFLPLYNETVRSLRAGNRWLPLPTFTVREWLGGLAAGVLLLLALTPVASGGGRPIRVAALGLGSVMAANALGHAGASVYLGWLAPGVYSSPILLVAALALLTAAWRGHHRG